MFNNKDTTWLEHAIDLADKADSSVGKNPFVGCVIIAKEGHIIGEGYHKEWGDSHAEVEAINNAIDRGYKNDLPASTIYVSLEPCSHTGKTPPCTDLIIKHKFKKVVVGMRDPNENVDGITKLQSQGIDVSVSDMKDILSYKNRGFIKYQRTGLPWITAKMAISIDGKIALANNESNWISNEKSRNDVQVLRSKVGAIITGRKTVEIDNPRLNVRIEGKKSPDVHILTRNISYQLPNDLNINKTENRKIYIKANKNIGARMLKNIAAESNTNHILLESGAELFSSFFLSNLIDEIILYQAPFIMGKGISLSDSLTLDSLSERTDLSLYKTLQIDNDLKMIYINSQNKDILEL